MTSSYTSYYSLYLSITLRLYSVSVYLSVSYWGIKVKYVIEVSESLIYYRGNLLTIVLTRVV